MNPSTPSTPANPFAGMVEAGRPATANGGSEAFPADLVSAIGDAILAGQGRGRENALSVPGHTDGATKGNVGTKGHTLRREVNRYIMRKDPTLATMPDGQADPKPMPIVATTDDGPLVVKSTTWKADGTTKHKGYVAGVYVGPPVTSTDDEPSAASGSTTATGDDKADDKA